LISSKITMSRECSSPWGAYPAQRGHGIWDIRKLQISTNLTFYFATPDAAATIEEHGVALLQHFPSPVAKHGGLSHPKVSDDDHPGRWRSGRVR
jgi:hypothetical protein